jgi:hypothetical protein
MNKKTQRNYVPLAVAALSVVLAASLIVVSGGQYAMAQNMTNMTGMNETGTMGGTTGGGGDGGGGDGGGGDGGDGGGGDGGGG